MSKSYTTYYLEMHSPSELRRKPAADGLQLQEIVKPQFQFNRFLYQLVGEPWQWTDNLAWSDEQWRAYVTDNHLRTWVAYYQGAVAGYFELQKQSQDTQIMYFGLAPDFLDHGFGGDMLSRAIEHAWNWSDTRRVWVHTCTLDHPHALNNYLARGFSIYKETVTSL
ncbi:GNAT family N-acetyltransferase [Gynuella sunshinyii]|uniref:Acetyltransferase n=1 Tax=Gynuella sunshinyii YC6258 TaxID=1445510 RepID=A0A0C5VSH0_9GAMM|nr:GNAT family N-acetyltransferase [Gynuella sunshinyii]AJQ97166.1 acetyltransferase [Gynuella sunshinyii YC6258]